MTDQRPRRVMFVAQVHPRDPKLRRSGMKILLMANMSPLTGLLHWNMAPAIVMPRLRR
jgi:hypothetical protein